MCILLYISSVILSYFNMLHWESLHTIRKCILHINIDSTDWHEDANGPEKTGNEQIFLSCLNRSDMCLRTHHCVWGLTITHHYAWRLTIMPEDPPLCMRTHHYSPLCLRTHHYAWRSLAHVWWLTIMPEDSPLCSMKSNMYLITHHYALFFKSHTCVWWLTIIPESSPFCLKQSAT